MASEARIWGAVRRRRRACGAGLMRGRMPDSFVDQPRPRPGRDIVDDIAAALAPDDDLIETVAPGEGAAAVLDATPEVRDDEAQEDVGAQPEHPTNEPAIGEGADADEDED